MSLSAHTVYSSLFCLQCSVIYYCFFYHPGHWSDSNIINKNALTVSQFRVRSVNGEQQAIVNNRLSKPKNLVKSHQGCNCVHVLSKSTIDFNNIQYKDVSDF